MKYLALILAALSSPALASDKGCEKRLIPGTNIYTHVDPDCKQRLGGETRDRPKAPDTGCKGCGHDPKGPKK